MNAIETKTKIVTFGMFLLPLILVKGTALMLGQGPERATAGTDPNNVTATTAIIAPVTREWSEEQLAATRHVELLRTKRFGPSPLLHQQPPPPPNNNTRPPDQPRIHPPPNVSVKTILKSGRGNIALINGRLYRVGDKIGDGWIVTVIDADARSVLIEHEASGEEATLTLPLP